MSTMSLEEFLKLAEQGRPIPVVMDMLADFETPLGAYWKLSHNAIHSFLLESVTGGEQVARYSFIGCRPRSVIHSKDRAVTVKTPKHATTHLLGDGEDALHFVQSAMPAAPLHIDGLPKFIGGAVGCISYDFVRFLEYLPQAPEDVLNIDDVSLMMFDDIVAFDHARNLIRVVALAEPRESGYADAIARLERIRAALSGPMPALPDVPGGEPKISVNQTKEQFCASVKKIQNYIAAGDGIQMVPSIRFSAENRAHPITIYRCLRTINPSPYMFILRFEDFAVVGASPELLVGLEGDSARVRPIAGTRWRGNSEAEDQRLESELLSDEKERAEHIMLVDLGRNDIGRVCECGTVEVGDLMTIERYSHVMHIVSDVRGKLRSSFSPFDLVRATFPAGTVSGAPKVRAMQIIDEVEPSRRGIYAGAVGYFAASGDLDLAIALRTIVIKDGFAHVQAGAGIVFDSVPENEFEECCNKAQASLQAILRAHDGSLFS